MSDTAIAEAPEVAEAPKPEYGVGDEAVISKGNYRNQKARVLAIDEASAHYAVQTETGQVAVVSFGNLRDERPEKDARLNTPALVAAIREAAAADFDLARTVDVLCATFPAFNKAWNASTETTEAPAA